MHSRRSIILALCLCLPVQAAAPVADTVRLAVAANFTVTAQALGEAFAAMYPYRVLNSTASTGVLVSQVMHGAPFDLLLSADAQGPAALVAAGLADGPSQGCYAVGRLVLLGGALDALSNPDLSLAIANPLTAPYGRAAQEVLQRPEFAGARERKLLQGSNVLQAYQFWTAGADLALVAAALVPGKGTPIPLDWYAPVEQHAVLLDPGAGNPAAGAYREFLRSDTARVIIRAAGYGDCP